MTLANLRPSTLTGIKTLARDIKVHAAVKQSVALDIAAGAAGFSNYKSALNHHSSSVAIPVDPVYPLYITSWWFDPKTKRSARETIRIATNKPLDDIVPRPLMRHARFLGGTKRLGPDHLVVARTADSQYRARHDVTGAARTITFMDATGLVPSKSWRKEFPNGDQDFALPGRDHSGIWYDRTAKQYVMSDEPYAGKTQHTRYNTERAVWAKRYNMDLQSVSWGGMYYPDGGSCLYLFTDATTGYDLTGLISRLNVLPPPVVEEDWTGETGTYSEEFLTPGMIAERATKQAQKDRTMPQPARKGPRNSATFHSMGGRRRSRPLKKLPVEVHAQIGELFKAVMENSRPSHKVYRHVNTIRSQVEDWMACEYSRDELDGPEFFQIYYKELKDKSLIAAPGLENAVALSQLIAVKAIMAQHYPDSAPLRTMIGKIDRVCSFLDV